MKSVHGRGKAEAADYKDALADPVVVGDFIGQLKACWPLAQPKPSPARPSRQPVSNDPPAFALQLESG